MEQGDSCQSGGRRGDWMKEGEGISQRTYMHDPQTQITVWCWPEGGGVGAVWRDHLYECQQ